MECQTADFTAYGVKCRNDDSLWSVIDNDFHSAGSLKRADVSSLTTDDASLDFIIVYMEDTDGIFHRSLRSHSLYCLYDDFLSLLIGIEFCLIHYLIDVCGRIGTRFILQTFHKPCTCFVGRES